MFSKRSQNLVDELLIGIESFATRSFFLCSRKEHFQKLIYHDVIIILLSLLLFYDFQKAG